MADLLRIYKDIFDTTDGKNKSNFSRCFPYRKEADFRKKIDLVLEEYHNVNGSYDYDEDVYSKVIEDTVKGYTSNKDALIAVIKEFNDFMARKYDLKIRINYPPIPVSNTFERLMFIAKYLQDEAHSVNELSDILWQSNRTIEADLAKLQGNDGDPLQICGRKFIIDEVDRSMGHVYFESTAHPFFLTCNLTQVIAMLEGLHVMSERHGFYGYAMSMARSIWQQLSDYGKQRIFYVMENLLSEDTSWFKSLDQEDEYSYKTERDCCKERDDILMYCMKDSECLNRRCNIEYDSGGQSEFFTDVEVLNLDDSGWKVNLDNREMILDPKRIIKCSFYKENMF